MTLSFENKEIRNICEDVEYAQSIYNDLQIDILRARLSELDAANTAFDFLQLGLSEFVQIDESSIYYISVGESYRLVFCVDHVEQQVINSKPIWNQTMFMKVIKIEKY